jgi:hypothetical protein
MTTPTQLYASNPLTLAGTEKVPMDTAAAITGAGLTQAIADLFEGTKGTDIASATTTNLAAATGVYVHVTGTTTITGLGTATAGTLRWVRFAGALLLTHNATSLILPTGANITTAANDAALFISEGSGNWRALNYMRADGSTVGSVAISDGSVTLAKLANLAANSIIGNNTGSSATPIALTGAQVAVLTQGDGLDADAAGFRGVPQNSQSGNYTCVAADAGKHVIHPSGAGASDTITIPANGSVAYEIGTAITFVNLDSNAVSIAITTDTMNLAGAGTTGTRTLAQYGIATALKVASTTWLISGTGLT